MAGFAKKLMFGVGISLGLWGLTELIVGNLFLEDLRNWASPPPPKQDEITMYGNPYLIFENVPGTWSTSNQHVNFTANINSMGFRAPELSIPKPDGIRRFITTGDSSVYGFGVNDADVFSSVAATKLGYKVEPINAAVPGYSSYQSLNLLKLRGFKMQPDLLVIANIWSDNNFDAFVDKNVLALYSGYEASVSGSAKRVLARSAIYRVLDWRLRLKEHRNNIIQKRKVGWQVGSNEHIGLRRVEINDYAENLESMVQMAMSNNAEVVFVMLANEDDLNLEKNEGKAWTPYRNAMKAVAEHYGAPLIDVPRLFIQSELSRQELFLDEMHPTAKGHAIMGKALAELLQNADWSNGGTIMSKGSGKSIPQQSDPFVKGSISQAVTGLNGAEPVKISGTLKFDGYQSGIIHLDAITAQTRNPEVVNVIQLDQPGSFALPVGLPKKVTLRAYIDPEGDGPDADDVRIDLSDTIFHLDQRAANNIIIDLDSKSIQLR